MREVDKIIIHCSDSTFGDEPTIDAWHKARGWDGTGYHYVILNGMLKAGAPYNKVCDGALQVGRHREKRGAHCLGQNENSIGIVLIGRSYFTSFQLLHALPMLLTRLYKEYKLTPHDVYGHSDFNKNKTCPNIDIIQYRRFLWAHFIAENR